MSYSRLHEIGAGFLQLEIHDSEGFTGHEKLDSMPLIEPSAVFAGSPYRPHSRKGAANETPPARADLAAVSERKSKSARWEGKGAARGRVLA
jgi:hypothetical protein